MRTLVAAYLDNDRAATHEERRAREDRLVAETLRMIPLSHYMYAMAAIPLAVEPIQKIRFLPYAHRRFQRFLEEHDRRFGSAGESRVC